MKVLIAGCGYVGKALARLLGESGHQVWGMSRTARLLPGEARPITADLADPDSLKNLPRGLDAVVYAASADDFGKDAYTAAYVDGPRHMLAALEDQGQAPRRVIFTSSTGVYGQSAGEWVDETSPAESEHFSGALLRRGEEVFLEGPFPAVIARLGGIYGPGRTRLIDRVRHGEATCGEDETRYTNRIHRRDAAGAIAHLLELEEPQEVYLVVDREPAERCEVLRWIAARVGAEAPRVVPGTGRRRGQRSNKRVSSRRLVASGYEHHYPTFREGYGAMIDAME